MRYPKFLNTQKFTLNLPALNGGLNLRESDDNILDNQLSECENMLFEGGFLTTRDAIVNNFSFPLQNAQFKSHKITFTHKEKSGTLVSAHEKQGGILRFFLLDNENVHTLPELQIQDEVYNVSLHKNTLYLFCVSGIYTLSATSDNWEDAKDKVYVPLIAVDCKYSGKFDGVFCEPFNILADSYSLLYTTKNEAVEWPMTDNQLHEMTYLNYFYEPDYKKYAGYTVTATLTDENGVKHTHSVVIGADGFGQESSSTDGYYMMANINCISFFVDPDYMYLAYKYKDTLLIKNDLTITFPVHESDKKKNKVLSATQNQWFGGGHGIYSGSRLFVSGGKDEPNLVHFSDINNPLYFPENNFFYVGSSPVRALCPQADMLVIFCENEIYYTKYTVDSSVSADDILNGSVTDYFSKSVYFPLTQISAKIGCDCPDTLQLLNNKLTFLNSNGSVYTLQSANKLSEHNIYESGQMILEKLTGFGKDTLKSATSADFDGKYILLLGNEMLVFYYNCYGFANLSAYTDSTDANLKTEWYFCTLPIKNYRSLVLVEQNGALSIAYNSDEDGCFSSFIKGAPYDEILEFDSGETVRIPIKSSFKTKSFCFGEPFGEKSVDSVNIFLNYADVRSLYVDYCTESHVKSTKITPTAKKSGRLTLYPALRKILKLGLKISAEGIIRVGQIDIRGDR